MANRKNTRGKVVITENELRAEYEKAMFTNLRPRVVDEDALMLFEISKKLGYRRSNTQKLVQEKIATGEWERVWKTSPETGKLAPAYRPAQKKSRREKKT